ncbi:hypothetical protein [Kitasatospora cineracea]|uniref:hypothetical protein n=1 Tax=Kitasatospora cineracea TaxID=88074 RepID=UPI003810E2EC
MDSQEGEKTPKEKIVTAGRIEMHLHAALRKHITDYLTPDTDDHHDLITACKELRMGRSNNSTTVWVTNGALGVALDICRGWLNDSNGSRVMAAKSTLKRHELEHVPDDPSERRYEFTMAKSLAISVPQRLWFVEKDTDADPRILEDLKPLGWHSGVTGRVRPASLRWLLAYAEAQLNQDHSAVKRAARKFIDTHGPIYAETLRQTTEFEAGGARTPEPVEVEKPEDQEEPEAEENEDQAPAAEVEGNPEAEPGRRFESVLVTSISSRYVYFGGLAKGPCDQGGPLVLVRWLPGTGGRNELVDMATYEVLATVHSNTRIWAAKVDEGQAPEGPAEGEQDEQEPEANAPEWRNTELRELPYKLRGQKTRILYGGRAGRRNPEPTMQVRAGINYTGESRYEVFDLSTDEVLATVMLDSRIWWAPLPLAEELEGLVPVEDRGPEESREEPEAEQEPQRRREVGPVPENFLFMAENANTPEARAWWARKVANWGKQK